MWEELTKKIIKVCRYKENCKGNHQSNHQSNHCPYNHQENHNDIFDDTRSYSCVITIFLALIFVCISALVLTLVESARVAGLHYHIKLASNSALESLFSEYNNELWDRYRIPSYEYKSEEAAMSAIAHYMQPYMDADSWMRMDSARALPTKVTTLTQGEGEYFEQDALSYMNYGLAESLFDVEALGDVDELWDKLKESKSISEITNDYAEKSKVALEVEESLSNVQNSLSQQQSLKSRALNALRNGSGSNFDTIADSLIREMRRMAGDGTSGGLLCDYEIASYELENQMDAVVSQHADNYANLSAEGHDVIEGVRSDYTDYSTTEKNRRDEVEEIYAITQDNISIIYNAKETADEIEALEWEMAEERAERAAERSSDPNYDPDPRKFKVKLTELWRELADAFNNVDIRSIQSAHGIADETKKNFLETAKSLLSGEVLALVVPSGTQVSTTALSMKGDTAQSGRTLPYLSTIQRAIMAEYIGHFFTEFTDVHGEHAGGSGGGNSGANSGGSGGGNSNVAGSSGISGGAGRGNAGTGEHGRTGVAAYEMEYICTGRSNDRDNLATSVAEVFAIREGLNYLHIMMDSGKRGEARALAEEIVIGASGGTLAALVPVVECLIIGVWAGAESVIDCRALLKGNKVALYKSDGQWKTNVQNILSWGESHNLTGNDDGDENGLTYEQYLKFLVLMLNPKERNSRAMDIIELNLCQSDPDFLMSNCIYGMDIEVSVDCTHIFTSLPIISGEITGMSKKFTMKTGAKKEY